VPSELAAAEHLFQPGDGCDRRADLDDEHHRVVDLHARVEFGQAVDQGAADDLRLAQRYRASLDARPSRRVPTAEERHQRPPSLWSRARLSCSTSTYGSPKMPSWRPPVY